MSIQNTIGSIVFSLDDNMYRTYGNSTNTSQKILSRLNEIRAHVVDNQPLPADFYSGLNDSSDEISTKIEELKTVIGQAGNNTQRAEAKRIFNDEIEELRRAIPSNNSVLEGGKRRHRKHKSRKARGAHKKRHTRRHKRATKRRRSLRRKN